MGAGSLEAHMRGRPRGLPTHDFPPKRSPSLNTKPVVQAAPTLLSTMINASITCAAIARALAVAILLAVPFANAFAAGPSSSEGKSPQQRPPIRPPPLPPTNNPHTLLGFDWLSPPKDFDLVHRAYRQLARR